MAIQTFPLVLKSVRMIAPEVKHFEFEREDKAAFPFIPGQFITFHIPTEEKTLRRSYSIATLPGEHHKIEFAAGFVKEGPASELLFHLKPGDILQATGPFGKLVLKDETPKRYILVATGTGVTPFRSMLPDLKQRLENSDLEVHLLLGVRTREHLIYKNDFMQMAKDHPNFHFHACYSREKLEAPESFEHTGYVQNYLFELPLDKDGDVVYLCGNPNMIDEAFNGLKERDFDIHNIRREKYISSN